MDMVIMTHWEGLLGFLGLLLLLYISVVDNFEGAPSVWEFLLCICGRKGQESR